MANLKQLSELPQRLSPGHSMCGGCGATIAVRQVLMGAGKTPVVCAAATGCLEVSTTTFPYTSWEGGFIHDTFESSAAVMSGVEAAFRGLKRAGKIPADKDIKFVAFGGDGGTYDIGLQALSGALERGHDFLYVCYDNGAYMNTGIQRSGATPYSAWTTTSEVGDAVPGKRHFEKDLTSIVAAHHIPYAAQTTFIGNMKDLHEKAERAIYTPGPAFLNVMSPCPRGWRYETADIMKVCKSAVETCVWPLYEVIEGKWILSYAPKHKQPIEEFLKLQGRFKHLFKPGNEGLIAQLQADVDARWEELLTLCSQS